MQKIESLESSFLGTLPPLAPLAVPYVPFQQEGGARYEQQEALSTGTLFPGLNLPFRLAVNAVPVPRTPRTELQALEFVLQELGLYLDTHPDDEEAFGLFQRYRALEQEAKTRFNQQCGPLVQSDAAQGKSYNWPKSPWPWEGGKD